MIIDIKGWRILIQQSGILFSIFKFKRRYERELDPRIKSYIPKKYKEDVS